MFGNNDHDTWDEHAWEQHIKSFEEQSNRLRNFFEHIWGTEGPAWKRLFDEYNNEGDIVDAFIEEELLFEESYFPDDDDFDLDDEEDLDDELFEMDDEDEETWYIEETESMTEEDEGELVLYERAKDIAVDLLKWHRRQPIERQDKKSVMLVTRAMQAAAKVAVGFSFGFDSESIGGNIVYCRKALQLCNEVLGNLYDFYHAGRMKKKTYIFIQEQLQDLRNDLGMYVQDLREEFRGGNHFDF